MSDSENTTVVIASDLAERLRADLHKVQPYPDGTLIRFKQVSPQTGQHYSYSAIFAGGQWWLSGQGNGYWPKSIGHNEFLGRLHAHGHVIVDLEVATQFEKIEL